MSTNVTTGAPDRARSLAWALPALLLVGLVVRLVFINNEGYTTDVSTFQAWAISLAEHGFGTFYNSGFADYPPGYFYVLALVGNLWEWFFKAHDQGFALLRVLVKLPAILADIGLGALIYAIARRFTGVGLSLAASALFVLNPAVIFNSAVWGQVDSVSGGLALFAIYCLLRSDDDAPAKTINWWIAGGWLAFAYSLLIKPQAAVILPLMIAFALVDPVRRRTRLISTLVGIGLGVVLGLLMSEPFHPSDPFSAFAWLFQRYAYGSSVYPYNSVNAFNLWSIRGSMWTPDSDPVTFFGMFSLGPYSLWGLLLVVAAVALIVWRYAQERTPRALLEGCAIAAIAFFMLATRMHERYLFNGLYFTIACLPFARRYLWGALAFTAIIFLNLQYALQYLVAVTAHTPGANTSNLWGVWTQVVSVAGVLTFFYLGYQYLGGETAAEEEAEPRRAASAADKGGTEKEKSVSRVPWARRWFDPTEGLAPMRALDYLVMGVLGAANFVLSFVGYWFPADKVFDEIYFARAGEEYLQNMRIYENTHPPLSKLLVTLSMMLFGGMPHGHGLGGWTLLNGIVGHMSDGDNSYGWRFLDVVFGALVVMLLYAFAKRITGSTIFATIAALLLTLDGMHFVQSRIATPEGFVVFFALLAVYAFYRFWISSQVGDRPHVDVPEWGFAAGAGVAVAAGLIVAFAGKAVAGLDFATFVVVTLYVAAGAYLLVRYVGFPRLFGDGRRELSFGEGALALRDAKGTTLFAPDGGVIDPRGKVQRGEGSQNQSGVLTYTDAPLTVEYRRDASVRYATPEGEATYADDEVKTPAGTDSGRSSKLWLMLFTVALGCLVSSKWYGVMGFGVSFVILIGIFLQRFFSGKRPTLWGNPRGFRIDGALVTILFVSMTVYLLAWVPDLARQSPDPNEVHNLNQVVSRQYDMYEYHHNLKATHPYSSQFFEWPIDYVPVAYYYQDHRKDQSDPKGCCIFEVTSMPNPFILWFGLLSVPWVAVLAWRERNKGYMLLVVTYLAQWLPWAASPRLIFAYHFYVDIPIICLCSTVVLQRIWKWGTRNEDVHGKWLGGLAVGAYVALVLAGFVYFYPILAAHPIAWADWNQRMWFKTWIIGPG